MRKIVLMSFYATLFTCLSISVKCQDVSKTNPSEVKVLSDTLGLRMLLLSVPPGGMLHAHTHPIFMFYVLEPGKFEFTYEDGKKEIVDFTLGMSGKGVPMKPHTDRNVGTTTIRILMIEYTGK